MKVYIPSNNTNEIKYVINTLFKEFLGLTFQIYINKTSDDIRIEFSNKTIILNNEFFNSIDESEVTTWQLPTKVYTATFNNFSIDALFGNNTCSIKDNVAYIGPDIIGSAFFMLTRWEEYAGTNIDVHNRFKKEDSVAYKFGLHRKPIVNEYIEFLWSIFKFYEFPQKRIIKQYRVLPTHDVDLPRLFNKITDVPKIILGDLIKRKDWRSAIRTLRLLINKIITGKDPFETFDKLMDISEKHGVISYFFFMSGGTSNKDNYYRINSPYISKLINNIQDRGHIIGFHPSYNAYNNYNQFSIEKKELEKVVTKRVQYGRQHFLRFEMPSTWRIWSANNMVWDSTMGYHDDIGFRCGVCYPFKVFDIIKREELQIVEKPLIAMDCSLIFHEDMTPELLYQEFSSVIEMVKKFNGEFVILWHNSAFATETWYKYEDTYEKIIAKACEPYE